TESTQETVSATISARNEVIGLRGLAKIVLDLDFSPLLKPTLQYEERPGFKLRKTGQITAEWKSHFFDPAMERWVEHFEWCDDDLITSDPPSDEEIVSLIKEKNDLIDDSSLDIEDRGDASSGSLISDAKATVSILQNVFATEIVDKNVMYSFLIIDKKID
ncbi:hypothetical protein AVEN_118943-1, partial [Araneus ventricosus]